MTFPKEPGENEKKNNLMRQLILCALMNRSQCIIKENKGKKDIDFYNMLK